MVNPNSTVDICTPMSIIPIGIPLQDYTRKSRYTEVIGSQTAGESGYRPMIPYDDLEDTQTASKLSVVGQILDLDTSRDQEHWEWTGKYVELKRSLKLRRKLEPSFC